MPPKHLLYGGVGVGFVICGAIRLGIAWMHYSDWSASQRLSGLGAATIFALFARVSLGQALK